MNDTFDRLNDLDLRSDTFENQDLQYDMGARGNNQKDHQAKDEWHQGGLNADQLKNSLLAGEPAPRMGGTLSEICDNEERDAVFNHTMQSGLFKNIHNSPLKEKLPKTLQMWTPGNTGGYQTFGRENEPCVSAWPKHEHKQAKDGGLKIGTDFQFNPKKFYCRTHPHNEVEYCNEISNNFYCRACLPKYQGQKDKILNSICKEVQDKLSVLKLKYLTKKETLIGKLSIHQAKVEEVYKIYQDFLDEMRNQTLNQEYTLRTQMESFERNLKGMISSLRQYSLVEFYHEESNVKSRIHHLGEQLDQFDTYLPQTKITIENMAFAKNQVKIDLKERINSYIGKVNHDFALQNYDYVLNDSKHEAIRDIYKKLGPFDHFQHLDPLEDLDDGSRATHLEFDVRKSGALYRGMVNSVTQKPDGIGFKVYPNGSVFEGYFEEGQINGYGRGVTHKGEVYQGPFFYDCMDGLGLFQWPDNRLFYGQFVQGKKQGHGTYMWPNGQVYEGEFKNDECSGVGILFYPDGKKYEGLWKDGKKHGKGIYEWPTGAKYHVQYLEGRQQKEFSGQIENTNVNLNELKNYYGNVAKKATAGKQFVQDQSANWQVDDQTGLGGPDQTRLVNLKPDVKPSSVNRRR